MQFGTPATRYDWFMGLVEKRLLAPLRHELLAPLRGRVLEIGAGTGINFAYYSPHVQVIAVEPNYWMRIQARRRAVRSPAQIVLTDGHAERLPAPPDAFDAVVSTFVLCSVADLERSIAELRRVLHSGGSALLIEHVCAEHPVWRALQYAWNPCQYRLGDGCRLTRDTVGALETAGFTLQQVRALGGGILPLRVVWAEYP
jgi:ubiquinone/menaquinone biosynthesis C-methylase UbiE